MVLDIDIPIVTIADPFPFPLADSTGPAAIYARISGQDSPATASLKTQGQCCIERAMSDRHTISTEHLFFERQSGYQTEHLRPKLLEIKQLVLRGAIRALYVYSTDRLARSDDLKFIVRWMEKRGCQVIFLNFERPKGPVGEFMLDSFAFASTLEIISLRDRTDRGRSDLRELGVLLGCGPCRYGYMWDKETRSRVAHPDHAGIIRLIFDLIGNQAWSTIRVAHYLNDQEVPSPYMSRPNRRNLHRQTRWTPTRVGYIIKERTYLGISLEGRTTPVLDEHGDRIRVLYRDKLRTVRKPVDPSSYREQANSRTERLIGDELFERANVVLAERQWKAARTRNDRDLWLLRGICFCGKCGYRMQPHKVSTRGSRPRSYYYCSTKVTRFRHDRAECDAKLARRADLDEAVWGMVEDLIRQPSLVRQQIEQAASDGNLDLIESEMNDLGRDLGQARRKLKQYEEAFLDATSTRLRKLVEGRVAEAERTVGELEQRREALAARLRPYQELDRIKDRIVALVEEYARTLAEPAWLTMERKREILEGLGVSVHAYNGDFKLRWRPPVSVDPSVVLAIPFPWKTDRKHNDVSMTIEFDSSPC